MQAIQDRRRRRSGRTDEALQLLLSEVYRRSDISSIALVDGRGLVVVGEGPSHELFVLGAVAGPAAQGPLDPATVRLTAGTDVMSCPVDIGSRRLYLAALGERVSRMPEAARGIERILQTG